MRFGYGRRSCAVRDLRLEWNLRSLPSSGWKVWIRGSIDYFNPQKNRCGTWIGNGIVRRGSICVPYCMVD